MKITKPYKDATRQVISQGYHSGHKALDMVLTRAMRALTYGTPLTAPENVEIIRIVGDSYTPEDTQALSRGYGIFMRGLETGFVHQYWHTLPILPVSVGDKVSRGKIVAFMGNAGLVRINGTEVPLDERLDKDKPGTHLHYEMMEDYDPVRHRKTGHVNPLDYIDWSLPTTYTLIDLLKATSVVLSKTLRVIS